MKITLALACASCLGLSSAALAAYQFEGAAVSAGGSTLQGAVYAAQSVAGDSSGGDAASTVYSFSSGVAALLAPAVSLAAVSLQTPSDGAGVSGTLTVTAVAAGPVAVGRVEFYADGVLQAVATSAPFLYTLDTRTLANGSHLLLAKPFDDSGNAGAATVTSIVVANGAPPAGAALGEVFAFPNPVTRGRATIHAQSSGADGVRLRVYDLTGALVHAASLDGPPGSGAAGQEAYEHVWETAGAAAGVYLYLLVLSAKGQTYRAMGKIAVIR